MVQILTGPGTVSTTMPASNWDFGPGVIWSPLCCSFIWRKTFIQYYMQPFGAKHYNMQNQYCVKCLMTFFKLTWFLLSKTSVGLVFSGTNWLGSSIFIGVPTLLPGCEDFIHWENKIQINKKKFGLFTTCIYLSCHKMADWHKRRAPAKLSFLQRLNFLLQFDIKINAPWFWSWGWHPRWATVQEHWPSNSCWANWATESFLSVVSAP